MKRSLGSSDSLGALMSICPTTSEDQHNHVYSNEFQSMLLESLDEDGCVEELGHMPEKKRRLKVEQVKALEKNFEVDNKLEPERKVKLAHELGLQPRQVAVWFQNRRARWKTKQLERDYGVLKANYDALKLNYDKIKGNNDALLKEIQEMKGKIEEDEDNENKVVIKEEGSGMVSENENPDPLLVGTSELNFESFNTNNINGGGELMAASVFAHDFKDGSSDSTSDDSSAVLNELDNNNNHSSIDHHHFLISNDSSSSSRFQFSESTSKTILEEAQTAYQPQFVKIEEHNFFSGEDSCNTFFCDDQAPTLHWYNSNEWT